MLRMPEQIVLVLPRIPPVNIISNVTHLNCCCGTHCYPVTVGVGVWVHEDEHADKTSSSA